MAPSPNSGSIVLTDSIKMDQSVAKMDNSQKDWSLSRIDKPFGQEQYVTNRIVLVSAHLCGLYYCYLHLITKQAHPASILFEIAYAVLGGLGTTVGCHRFWTHKTFKANKPLQTLLMMMQTTTLQYPIYKWCLDHRIHHKYTDTNADPHNSKRGFWFSHIGWLVLPKTKELTEKQKTFDMPDLQNDPIILFQSRWYFSLVAVFHFLIPISIYYYVFGMPLLYCYLANCRSFLINLHATCCINSVAHLWGDKPYDKTISPVESKILSFVTSGEGWHNYHHTFPWDYRASEFSQHINFSTVLIDFFAWIGWAWDMKTVPEKIIHERMNKTGDGSRVAPKGSIQSNGGICEPLNTLENSELKGHVWGWGDENISDELRKITSVINQK